jgi:hypothetical protein
MYFIHSSLLPVTQRAGVRLFRCSLRVRLKSIKLAVRLYWMMRQGWDYGQWNKFGSHAGQPGNRDDAQSNTE